MEHLERIHILDQLWLTTQSVRETVSKSGVVQDVTRYFERSVTP